MAQHIHGTDGAFVGGEWTSIEDCAANFNERKKSCDMSCKRSKTKVSAAKADDTYDVIIIGAGCIGGAIARELSKSKCSVLVLEAADDVSQGATKGNSGIVHAGYDDTPGSVRAKFCWPGNQMFVQLDKELKFGYQRNGSLVIARGADDEAHLKELLKRGEINGVRNLRIIGKDELFAMEPYVHPDSTGALYAPDAGNLIPYEYTIALLENAVQNGVEVRIRREVISITESDQVSSAAEGGQRLFEVTANHWEPKSFLDNGGADELEREANPPHKSDGMSKSMCVVAAFVAAFLSITTGTQFYIEKISPAAQGKVQILIFVGVFAVVYGSLTLIFAKSWAGNKRKNDSSADPVQSFVSKYGAAGATVGEALTAGTCSRVTVDQMRVGGSGSKEVTQGSVVAKETYRARFILNCAGSASDKIANLIGDKSFYIKPRIGDYVLLNKNQGHLAKCTLFPCPGPLGKGVLVQTTLWGNLILGPTARDLHDPAMMAQTPEDIQTFIFSKCKELVPTFDPKETIHAFCGVRAKSSRNDWIIEPSAMNPRFIHAAGIDSPGLAGSPAIALELVRLLVAAGLQLIPNHSFNPNRFPLVCPKSGWKGIRAGPVGKVITPAENIVCKCEKVTEAEVIAACHGPLPVDSTQAIRKRTRAGMGHCQGNIENYDCERRVAAIIARELGLAANAVGRRPWPASSTLPQRWINDEEKEKLVEFMHNA